MRRIKAERKCHLSDAFFRNVIKIYGNSASSLEREGLSLAFFRDKRKMKIDSFADVSDPDEKALAGSESEDEDEEEMEVQLGEEKTMHCLDFRGYDASDVDESEMDVEGVRGNTRIELS